MTELQLSYSPRTTWLWAADLAAAERVRWSCGGQVASRGGQLLPLVTDVGIGIDAYEACNDLAAQGFTFTWHESNQLNRSIGGWESRLPGMPGA